MGSPAISHTPPPDFDRISSRIDNALLDNRRAENIVIGMAIGIFLLGTAIVVVGYWRQNAYVASPAALFQGILYWPIREILRLRRENIVLQTVPAIVSTLPVKDAASEIKKLLQFLRGDRR